MKNNRCIANDVEAVITSYNQKDMILEAVYSLCNQTMLPANIIVVDDGSTDRDSIEILEHLKEDKNIPVPITVVHQSNGGVSKARNTGISKTQSPMVLILDGDDKLEPSYIEEVRQLLVENSSIGELAMEEPTMVAASSWMHTFGVLDSIVCASGGDIVSFLPRNCCPATHMLRREIWEKSGGYDNSMRQGFEDWDFFLSMLETNSNAHIGIVPKPLICYRTAPASANIKSMEKRLELMRFIMEKHKKSYQENMIDVILGLESISMSRLYGWETEIGHALLENQSISQISKDFVKSPSYGDGGMAAAVRIASLIK